MSQPSLLLLTVALLAACAGDPPLSPAGPDEPSLADQAVEVEPPQAPDGADTLYFPEDPLSDPDAEVSGSRITQEHLWSRKPERILVELEAPPDIPTPDAELIQRSSEMALARLKARALTEELGRLAQVDLPPGPHTMGTILPVRFTVQNPYPDAVELLPSPDGLVLELNWTVERWLAVVGHDRVSRHRYFRLSRPFKLEGGGMFEEFADLPLRIEGDEGALWVVRVDARLRCAGARFDEEELPVHDLEFHASQVLALPRGWEAFREQPYATLEALVTAPQPEVDRNLLVCAALLDRDHAYRAVDMLLDRMNEAPHDRRRLSMTQVLQWLTGLELGSLPEDWLRWREKRRMAAVNDKP